MSNIEKLKRPIFWNGGGVSFLALFSLLRDEYLSLVTA